MPRFDLLIKNSAVIDPLSGFSEKADLAVTDGKIAEISSEIDPASAEKTLDATGLVTQPGIIDTHLHLAGSPVAFSLIARAGVTSCIDMTGTAESVFKAAAKGGSGISVAVMNAILPGKNVSGQDPSAAEILDFAEKSLASGAYGIKLLGGHFPLTPEASGRMIETAADNGIYMAWHVGSTKAGSDLSGVREAFAAADGRAFHLCHHNGYCRGLVADVIDECHETASLLEAHPEVIGESYVSARSGCPLTPDENGDPKSKIVHARLRSFGYSTDREGMFAAIRDGVLGVIREEKEDLAILTGREGVEYYVSMKGQLDGTFDRVNPFLARMFFAAEKRKDGTFLTDAISTDGGKIPRNVILSQGLSCVKLSALSALEFAAKTSLLPARMLKLQNKGHFSIGADADITVYDPERQEPVHSFVQGTQILHHKVLCGRGASFITTQAGAAAVRAAGFTPVISEGGIPALDRSFGGKTL